MSAKSKATECFSRPKLGLIPAAKSSCFKGILPLFLGLLGQQNQAQKTRPSTEKKIRTFFSMAFQICSFFTKINKKANSRKTPKIAQNRPKMAKNGLKWVFFELFSTNLGKIKPKSAQKWPKMGNICPKSGHFLVFFGQKCQKMKKKQNWGFKKIESS